MIGSTGVGKTEIARRLAKLTNAPFIKVEATKYTEVGYYGRDVESMIRELLDNSISLVRDSEREHVRTQADKKTTEKLLDLLCPPPASSNSPMHSMLEDDDASTGGESDASDPQESWRRTRSKMEAMLLDGKLETRNVEVTVEHKAAPVMMGGMNIEPRDDGEDHARQPDSTRGLCCRGAKDYFRTAMRCVAR